MSEISINDHGLVEDMQKLVENFNADTYDYVKKEGLHLRKNVARSFAAETNVRNTSKSLGKTTSYKQEVVVTGKELSVDIWASSPQFHLVERGHALVDKNGNTVGSGYVPGKFIMEREKGKFVDQFQKETRAYVERMLKKHNL